jgi:hypothetical protein
MLAPILLYLALEEIEGYHLVRKRKKDLKRRLDELDERIKKLSQDI